MSTSAAAPVSRPIEADSERHLRDAAVHPASAAKASIAAGSAMYWMAELPRSATA